MSHGSAIHRPPREWPHPPAVFGFRFSVFGSDSGVALLPLRSLRTRSVSDGVFIACASNSCGPGTAIQRQKDAEGRAFTETGLEGHGAAVIGDQLARHEQPQAGAVFFGREVRLK